MQLNMSFEDTPNGLSVHLTGSPNGVTDDASDSLGCLAVHQLCLYLRKLKDTTGLQLNVFTSKVTP